MRFLVQNVWYKLTLGKKDLGLFEGGKNEKFEKTKSSFFKKNVSRISALFLKSS